MTAFFRFAFLVLSLIGVVSVNGQGIDNAVVGREVDSLLQSGKNLISDQKFEIAQTIIESARKKASEGLGVMSVAYANATFDLGLLFYHMGMDAKSEALYLESKSIREKILGTAHPDFLKNLNNLAALYADMGDYDKSEALYLESKVISDSVLGHKHPEYILSINGLASIYFDKGEYEKAEVLFLEVKKIREETLGKEHPDYALILTNIAVLYDVVGEYNKAEPYYIEAMEINLKFYGKNHKNYAESLRNFADHSLEIGNFEKAEALYIEAVGVLKRVLGTDNRHYLACIANLAVLYNRMGNKDKAKQLDNEAEIIAKKILGENHPFYANIVQNLGVLYFEQGDFEKAEPLYVHAMQIREKSLGTEHPAYAMSLHNLATLYYDMGNYNKSLSLLNEVKVIREKTVGKDHPDYAWVLNSLANIYIELGKFNEAEPYFLEAKSIREKSLGKDNPEYAWSLMSLALFYQTIGDFSKAELLFIEAKDVRAKVLGQNHPDYAVSLHNLAACYELKRDYSKAEDLYNESKYIFENNYGNYNANYSATLLNLSKVYWLTNRKQLSESYLIKAINIDRALIKRAERHLSETELSSYLSQFNNECNIVLSFSQTQKELSSQSYDNALFFKGILLNKTSMLNRLSLSDSSNAEKYYQLKSIYRQLSDEYSKPLTERTEVDKLEGRADMLEKELVRSISKIGQSTSEINSRDVLNIIELEEASIEFVHFQNSNPEPTDSIIYAALILLPKDSTPHFIPLFEEKQLTTLLEKTGDNAQATTNLYAARTGDLLGQAPTYGKELYNLIWRPLDSLLRGVKTVYFSPSGLLHRVAFAALPVDGKKVLSDKYELRQLGSTRSLVVKTPEPVAQNYTAAVFGGVQYDRSANIPADSTAPEITDNRLWTLIERPRAASDEGFDYLPGTAQEAASLTRALQAQRVQTQTHTGAQASEEILKSLGRDTVKSPDILHIATHGFFFPDPEKRKDQRFGEENAFKWNENPLFRSGLALSGANAAWSGQPAPGNIEDGIATAYEISHLNLSNTKLVVLSACESGLGDIKGSEGVYGLQRAFKMAGADYLLVSLWQVPDKETVEFMDLFYKSWLGGKTIHEAFAKAQKKMRKKYKEVYKWGAWVLVE